MLIDASNGGSLREKTDFEVKTSIENMCQNEYRSSEQADEGICVLAVDTQMVLLAQMKALTK